ncbi:MAG: hypothetical protein AAF481_16875 [Acidobacteriota bacterium]
MTILKTFLALSCAVAVVAPAVVEAQTPVVGDRPITITPTPSPGPFPHVPRVAIPLMRPARSIAHTGPISSSVSAAGLLHDGLNGAEALTGVVNPGDFQKLSDGSFLVAGRRAGGNGAGTVEYWRKDVFGNLFGASLYVKTGSDFSGVVYDENSGFLYLLDAKKKKIWRASWNGFGQLPQSYSTWATTADVGALHSARDRYLDLVWPAGDDPATDPGHVYLGLYPDPLIQGRALSGSAGNITNALWDWRDQDLAPDFIIDAATVSESSFTLDVVKPTPAASATAIDIVHLETGFVRGIGTMASGDDRVSISLTAPVVLGDSYVARESGQPTTSRWAMRAMRRYGFPEAFSNGTALRPIFTPPDSFIGNPILTMLVGMEIDSGNPPAVIERDYFGTLRVGVRSFSDPVVPLGGGQFWLSPTTQVVPAVGRIGAAGHGLIGATINIPFNGGLIGQVWFVQFEVTDPDTGGIVRSEVVGFEILPFF